ncbi:MAG: hypothetical protein ACAH95_08575 [Fimbriimonas sp.]
MGQRKRHGGAVASIASFDAEQFALLKIRAADADRLHDTYEEWRKDVDRIEREMRAKGVEIQEVPMTVLELEDFCLRNDCPLDGAARAAYAVEKSKAG